MKIQTYGKANLLKSFKVSVKERFKPNKYSVIAWKKKGCSVYVPKLNKTRFGASVIISGVLCSPLVPFGFVAVGPVMKWGLR